ncbi:MAG: hypothetical protein GY941_18210 [Planctomycetes bacterium]|nr:hypothetical protein [Planctomycetota bacterium]
MLSETKGLERRLHRRLELSLLILLPGQKVESKNISSAGVYFEMDSDHYDDVYYPGRNVCFEIMAEVPSAALPVRSVWLSGRGKILRKTLINTAQHENGWGIAIQFNERLEIAHDPICF